MNYLSDRIVLDHGTGGKLSGDLIRDVIVRCLGETHRGQMEDSTVLEWKADRIAITTDSFVLDPIFFHGGNIGKLAVCGTVNDLAVSGAKPLYLTLAFVLEEGFPLSDFEQILHSIRDAALEAEVYIVAGDTKVVKRGEVDKIFINTSGIGIFQPNDIHLSISSIRPGDDVIISGQLGNHSIHILSIREGLGFERRIQSDCAPLNDMIAGVLKEFGNRIHCMRDITRGGLGTLLNEISQLGGFGVRIEQVRLPILHETVMAADMLGVNPLYLANEGNVCIFASSGASKGIVETLRRHRYGEHASVIGKVLECDDCHVVMCGEGGEEKIVQLLQGAELPRLC